MYYKLSNIAGVGEMERVFDANFKYPHIHLKAPLINGLDEELLPIITDTDTSSIQFGIWGILPEGFKEDWEVFQKTQNTLNLSVGDVLDSDKFTIGKRCVVIVSGFFMTYLYQGEIYPFYAYPKSKKPFAVAGVYNTTYDGYKTFGLLLTNINAKVAKYHNISKKMPIVLSHDHYKTWLSSAYKNVLKNSHEGFEALDFQSHPVAREFYKNEILFDSFLDPAGYESLAIPFST